MVFIDIKFITIKFIRGYRYVSIVSAPALPPPRRHNIMLCRYQFSRTQGNLSWPGISLYGSGGNLLSFKSSSGLVGVEQ